MQSSLSAQEEFWSGPFGDAYISRNEQPEWLAASVAMFSAMLRRTEKVGSVIELGANIGLNCRALRTLLPAARIEGVEINASAHARLASIDGVLAHHSTLFGFNPEVPADLAFTVGVLIHLAPDRLPEAYETLYRAARRYILVAEYYNPSPVEVPYRGHRERLFKRDFAGELLNTYADLRLIDYGFFYRRDPAFVFDDINWFLIEKR